MAKKNQYTSGRDIAQALRDRDVNVRKNGSYLTVSKDGRTAYIPDTARDLPKPVRLSIMKILRTMGLLVLLILILVYLGPYL